jgi:flagellar hook-associated protein 3 FlgL
MGKGFDMRVTNNMLINNMIGYIEKNLNRMGKYQYQLATGKKISSPSDDPVVAARALKFRTDLAEIYQYKRNVQDAQSWMEVTEDTITKIGDILQRARELSIEASNSTKTPTEMGNINEEIKQLKKQIIHMANTTYAGRHIFSGFSTNTPLINDEGEFVVNVANVDEQILFEIGIGDSININVPGGNLFNSGVNAAKGEIPEFIGLFNKFINALDSHNHDEIDKIIDNIDKIHDNLLKVRADVGARLNRLELTSKRLENDIINYTKLMSLNEDVDEAEIIINLKNEENVYRASLAGGARIIMPTLLDFLR